MLTLLTNLFTKITAWPVQKLCFRTKVYYEDKKIQGRHIKGSAIVIANHTSVFDVAIMMFVFFTRSLRCQVAEVIFAKKVLGLFMRMLGAVYVNRDARDFSFLAKSEQILRRGGVMEIYPESRIPLKTESTPLEFKPSGAYLALVTNTPVIPVYTDGHYFTKQRCRVIIGTPITPDMVVDDTMSERESIVALNNRLREKIIELRENLYEQVQKEKK